MAKPSGRRTSQFSLPQGQPQPSVPSLMNSFVGGLKTEFTGLNFPENAATDTQNCTFTRVGNVTRRQGIDYELNFVTANLGPRTNLAISTFVWTNAGGDGNSQILVAQVGSLLAFYNISGTTTSNSLSSNRVATTVSLTQFMPTGGGSPSTTECQFAAGNGYLFVFNTNIDPIYCTYTPGPPSTITASVISVLIRDFVGNQEPGVPVDLRPIADTGTHLYNLMNQGWTRSSAWNATSTSAFTLNLGLQVFVAQSGLSITTGTAITATGYGQFGQRYSNVTLGGSVSAYAGTNITINVTSINPSSFTGQTPTNITWNIVPNVPGGQIATFGAAASAFPSNADVWWTFKDSTGAFNPAVTVSNITLSSGPAPKGFYIFSTFDRNRNAVSGLTNADRAFTLNRASTGSWFQGRVWYSGVNASYVDGNGTFTTWTEDIYFSQIIQTPNQFGMCYQANDPTSETLFDLLPTDGGVITIQGSGAIYKLFSVSNGLLVFAANGIWFITGNAGLGFTANDYTVTKISGEHCISGTSFVDVAGYPMFWNNEAIYAVVPGQSYTSGQRSLEVKNLTLPSIKQFYQSIPLASKLYARGSYNHITGVVQWLYKSTQETDITSRYTFDSVLNFLTYTEAFYNWTISPTANLLGVNYIEFTGATPALYPTPTFKYFTFTNLNTFTFSEERDNVNWQDWNSTGTLSDYTSYFVTAYNLAGKGQKKFQPQYIWMYSEIPTTAYTFQGLWDFNNSPLSNRTSSVQVVTTFQPLYNKTIRKLRVRGNGYVLQFKVGSQTGQPFNISGWSVVNTLGIS
jgi:hypothetical protein